MPKIVLDAELVPVLEAMEGVAEPLSIDQITRRINGGLPRRTLQRRLASLVHQERLLAEGERGGRRYRLPNAPRFGQVEEPQAALPEPTEIPLSTAAKEIRASVRRPLSMRRPVGYQPAFLENYRPNISHYLQPEHLQKLTALGQVSPEPQPAGTYFRKVMDRLLIDLSWNSSRLEGNTYSLLETERLLELGENAAGKNAGEAQMLLNHKAAIELLSEQAAEIGFNRYTVCNLHALLADNLLPDPRAGGRIRNKPVGITGTVFYPLEGPQAIEENFQQILDKAEHIENAFEQAFFVMVHLPYLQPFEDVNKRVSRLAANVPLVRHNLCPLSFVDVPQADYVHGILGVYELNRIEYLRDVFLWAYERSCYRYSAIRQSLGEPDAFRLKYRAQIGKLVAEIVRHPADKRAAGKKITAYAETEFALADRKRFLEVVETELSSLHEGNIARYRLRPSEYHTWQAGWR